MSVSIKYMFFSLRWCSISQMVLFIFFPCTNEKAEKPNKNIKLLTVGWYLWVSHLITLLGFIIYFERWEKWWQSILPTSSWTWWSDGGTCDFKHKHTAVTYLRVLLFFDLSLMKFTKFKVVPIGKMRFDDHIFGFSNSRAFHMT